MAKNDSKNRLGKGLSAIFGEDIETALEEIQRGERLDLGATLDSIPIDKIRTNPYQPRRVFDEKKLQELSDSIVQHGLFTPILVRRSIHGYELVAGERRWRASKLGHLENINAMVVDMDDEQMMEISLIENIQREDLNVIEEARAYQQMIDKLGYTQEDIAKKVSKSRAHVANLLRLLKLPDEVIELVIDDKLQMGHVRPLITLNDKQRMIDIAKRAVKEKLSVREVESLVKNLGKEKTPKRKIEVGSRFRYPIELLEKKLETKVEIDQHKITISFTDEDDLNRILEVMGALEEL